LFFEKLRSAPGTRPFINILHCHKASLCEITQGCDIKQVEEKCFIFDQAAKQKKLIIFVQEDNQFFVLVRTCGHVVYVGMYDLWMGSGTDTISDLAIKTAKEIECSSSDSPHLKPKDRPFG
jgi:hypothetical protein